MHLLSEKGREFVRYLKKVGILRIFSREDMKKITRNGGVFFTCSDGDIDISDFYNLAVSERNHEIKLFGGSLTLCTELEGYDPEEARVVIRNIRKGFKVKRTKTLCLGHHFPCGVAIGHTIEEVLYFNYLVNQRLCGELLPEINKDLPPELHLRAERIFDFFHVKRINKKGEIEQNMYIFDTDLYEEYFIRKMAV